MISGSDEYNDPYKIDITLDDDDDDDEDNHRKLFFEEGLGALLSDPHFLLLHVPDNETKKMQIIRPANDSYHRKRMIKRINEAKPIPSFYYALSHLWGITKDYKHLWYDVGDHVDDENGEPVEPVSMRPEKRDTLLLLLKNHPDSYWWIDVLCARTDTPLDIMGDIYACCLACYAMIDCHAKVISQLCIERDDEPKNLDDAAWKFANTGDVDFVIPYKQYYEQDAPRIIDLLRILMESKWWQRVWTWQEMALPIGDVHLLSEETTTHRCQNITIILEDTRQLAGVIFTLYYAFETANDFEPRWLEPVYNWVNEMASTRKYNKDRIKRRKSALRFSYLIESLSSSTRRCMDPVDYVYGVLGLFRFKIPRMTDPDAVWQHFLTELEIYVEDIKNECFTQTRFVNMIHRHCKSEITGINKNAQLVNLLTAQNMADVYGDLITIVDMD